jgi:hypothetical protein
MTSYEEHRKEEERLELIAIRYALLDEEFRLRCLKTFLRRVEETSPGEGGRHFFEIHEMSADLPGLKVQMISTYRLHSLLDEIPNNGKLQMKDLHENSKDHIIDLCMLVILNPLIDAGCIHSIRPGYHELIVAYFPAKLSEKCRTDRQLRDLAAIPIDDASLRGRLGEDFASALFKKARALETD